MKDGDVSHLKYQSPTHLDKRVLEELSQMLEGLRFGSVEITVHESRVTQIERKEKVRLA